MNRGDFEHQVLTLWMTTRVPLTRANLQFVTKVERKQLDRWLDEMLKAGTLEFDSDDKGELLYTVPGADRPKDGPTNVAAFANDAAAQKKLAELKKSLPRTALVKRSAAASLVAGAPSGDGKNDRSLVASGALSFFLGPFGWLYAAPLKESVPAIVIFWILIKLVPSIFLPFLLGILLPLSAVAGVGYAWLYNRQGGRTSLVDVAKNKQLPP